MKILAVNETHAINLDYLVLIEIIKKECKIIIHFLNSENHIISCDSEEDTILLYKRIMGVLEGLSKI